MSTIINYICNEMNPAWGFVAVWYMLFLGLWLFITLLERFDLMDKDENF